jgi:LacI family transcriptional regulator
MNITIAYRLYSRARERNVRIHEDLSVVGFDDIEFSCLIDPPLTTIRQSAFVLGQEAANRVILEMMIRPSPASPSTSNRR